MAEPGKPTIYNLVLTTAGTEYSQAIPEFSSKLMVKARSAVDIRLAFGSTETSDLYITIPAGQTYWDDLVRTCTALYFQDATNDGTVVEILVWSGA